MSGLLDGTVMWLTWRQLFARRRLWLALAFSLAPLLLTLFFKVVADDHEGARAGFFLGLQREIVIGTLLPLAAVVFGTTAFGGEIDDGTLVYLLVKPLQRWRVVLSKYVVAVLSTVGVLAPAVLLPWMVLSGPEVPSTYAWSFFAGACAGAAAYCALFLLLGLMTRRALTIGLFYVIAFEGIISRSLAGVRSLSVREFALSVSKEVSRGAMNAGATVPMSTVYTMGTVMLAGALLIAVRKVSRYQLVEKL